MYSSVAEDICQGVPRASAKNAMNKEVTMAVPIRPAAIAVGFCLVFAAAAQAEVFSPESFTHGTSEQRMQALRLGLETGDDTQCDRIVQ